MNLHESFSVVNKLLWLKYVDNSKRQRQFYQSTGTLKRAEQNLIVRTCKSEAELPADVTNITNNFTNNSSLSVFKCFIFSVDLSEIVTC